MYWCIVFADFNTEETKWIIHLLWNSQYSGHLLCFKRGVPHLRMWTESVEKGPTMEAEDDLLEASLADNSK